MASDKNDDRPTGKNTPASDSDEYMDPVLTVTESYGGGNTQPDPMVVEIVIDLLMMVAQLLLLFHHQMLTSIIDSAESLILLPAFVKIRCQVLVFALHLPHDDADWRYGTSSMSLFFFAHSTPTK